ncbi:condensation domain-containing protein [Prosthecobacter sp.]|uniref:condensation domain-containing protein n=1 Tax=Prosthecobacter sp. TaxID=1965333 RepID=UPI00248A19FF|nr:condensation domain-containing protein [Prosthecobacter sp.]MDI1312864.1 condensation domain-containing protein [Prosthecobacter sp.]
MSQDTRSRLKQWLESGEARLQPLTFPQQELWQASPVPAGDVANHICALINVRGPITPQGCEAAVQKVSERQEVFRLSFLPGKEQPMQLIRRSSRQILQFRELSPEQQEPEAVEELAQEIFRKPFNMVGGPLFRTEVLRRSADDHVLVVAIHHAIADGWTVGVFVQDLFAAYMQELRGIPGGLPPVPLSYSDWGAAERAYWQPALLGERSIFWKERLANITPLWSPPTGPAALSGERRRWVFSAPADVGRAVRELAKRNGATLFSTLLAAFQVTLSKWTGKDDILVGTPVANRNKQAVRETMGYCAGIVPLRGHIDRDRTFSERLRKVHEDTVDSFANAMPFSELVKGLGMTPAPGCNPIFQVRFALQNHPVPDISVNGMSLQLRMRSTGTPRFDLACEVTEEGDAFEVVWLCRPGMFSGEDIHHLHRMYLGVLTNVCSSPEILTAALMTTTL